MLCSPTALPRCTQCWPMADRRRLLARMMRLYAAQRHVALSDLAARRAEQQRMDDIARRSRDLMASVHLSDGGGLDGAELRDALAFQARITSLAGQAHQLGEAASGAESAARTALAEADRRLDRVRERHGEAQRQADGRELARSLLNGLHTPRGPL